MPSQVVLPALGAILAWVLQEYPSEEFTVVGPGRGVSLEDCGSQIRSFGLHSSLPDAITIQPLLAITPLVAVPNTESYQASEATNYLRDRCALAPRRQEQQNQQLGI